MSIDDTIAYLSKRKILLVEDNEINLEIETAILEGIGFQIDTAENGSIAVEMIEKAAKRRICADPDGHPDAGYEWKAGCKSHSQNEK